MLDHHPRTSNQIFRIDTLIGCGNLLGFSEWLSRTFDAQTPVPLSLIFLDARSFRRVNVELGYARGDDALRWIGIVLMEDSESPVYRIGGDELVAIMIGRDHEEHAATARRIFERLEREAQQFGLSSPPVTMAVIHYTGCEGFCSSDVMIHLGVSLFEIKNSAESFGKFSADEIQPGSNTDYAQWIAGLITKRIVSLGEMLDESHHMAYTDPVTGLPNMRAAQGFLEAVKEKALEENQPFSILLVDGDDLRHYNKISYAEGDKMIQRLASLLADNLRPGDFLARWRVGDEFIILLPATLGSQARVVGERLVAGVAQGSSRWRIPVTISIGAASFPEHGDDPFELLELAEAANAHAKNQGKNCVVLYTPAHTPPSLFVNPTGED